MASTPLQSTTENLSKLAINADFASSAPNLQINLHLLSPQQVRIHNHTYIYISWTTIFVCILFFIFSMVLIGNGGDVADWAGEDVVGVGADSFVWALAWAWCRGWGKESFLWSGAFFYLFLLWIYNYMEILFFHVDFFFHDCGVDLYVKICELF